ncbi:coatomer subunit delta-like [Tubulanus polymorphus]|uniref:coatomer subunit delta-like n=1 Tax=Tubulanus polymorphus TaxID=672921 RepID=UPI003DA299C6
MVLLAAAVCNKAGKAIVSRQFVEMTRSRIEGLLAAFPKLMNTGKQHTFVETESVRYVYQPLEKLYVLLITTKASNILEDLETLRLFARVIPEYSRNLEENEIINNAFSLIFAFDEIVALGYRENVNLAQIRTFTEMDSHEEKVFQAVRQTQEREAKENMKRRAKELQQQRREIQKRGGKSAVGYGGGFGSSSMSGRVGVDSGIVEVTMPDIPKQSYTSAPSKPSGTSRAMKLGSKSKDVDMFVDQLKSEGQQVTSTNAKPTAVQKISTPAVNQESVHLRMEEKISLTAGRDGGLQNMEVHGLVMLRISDDTFGRIKIGVINNDTRGIQLQTHPNVDKKLFQAQSTIALKNPSKPFPVNQDVGVLKWRFQTQDEANIPLSINCWPSENGPTCDVNIEYELENEDLELNNVVISIPVPSGVGAPVVNECEGEYTHDSRKNILEWHLDVIDSSNKSGSMEFSINGHPDDFFPVNVTFSSQRPFCELELMDVKTIDDSSPVKFSKEILFYVEKYEIV